MQGKMLFDEFSTVCQWIDCKDEDWYCMHSDNDGALCNVNGCPLVEPAENEEDTVLQYCEVK